MTEQAETPSSWERWYKVATSFVAPATFVTALLFYVDTPPHHQPHRTTPANRPSA
jgi:hypothetical protein